MIFDGMRPRHTSIFGHQDVSEPGMGFGMGRERFGIGGGMLGGRFRPGFGGNTPATPMQGFQPGVGTPPWHMPGFGGNTPALPMQGPQMGIGLPPTQVRGPVMSTPAQPSPWAAWLRHMGGR